MSAPDGIVTLLTGLLAGGLAGVFGVGGGIVMVPAMVIVLGFSQHLAQGTSLLVVIPTAAVGAALHYRKRLVQVDSAIAVAGGGVLGAVIGSFGALRIDAPSLRLIFVVYLALMGLRMLIPSRKPSGQSAPKPGVEGSQDEAPAAVLE